MYVKYTWLATATEAQVRSDIIAIMTGATSSSGLSASCDTANTVWYATSTTTNWTVHDSAPAAGQGGYAVGTSQVLKSLNADGTSYKYAQVGLTGGILSMVAWENWNNTGSNTASGAMYPGAIVLAHGGFNIGFNQGTQAPNAMPNTFAYSTPASIYIFTTPRYLVVAPSNVTSTYGGISILEFSRDTNSLDSTYPCVASFNVGTNMNNAPSFGITRFKKPGEVGDYGASSPALANPGTNLSSSSHSFANIFNPSYISGVAVNQLAATLGAGEVPYTLTSPIVIGGAQSSTAAIVLGKVQGGILNMPSNVVTSNSLDEMQVGGSTYVIIKSGGSATGFLVPKA